MLGISQDQAYTDIKPHIRRVWECIDGGFRHYRTNYPDLLIHRTATKAAIVNDLIVERIIAAFDELPGCRPIPIQNQIKLMSISDRVTLWFKKMDSLRQTANYPTDEAIERDGGQSDLFGEAQVIVAGYILNEEETAIRCISFTPPKLVRPRWFIDVEVLAQPLRMKGPTPITAPKIRLKIDLGPQQFELLG
jgi:hypothetical protein